MAADLVAKARQLREHGGDPVNIEVKAVGWSTSRSRPGLRNSGTAISGENDLARFGWNGTDLVRIGALISPSDAADPVLASRHRTGGGVWLAEVVATLGLLLVIFAIARSGRGERVAFVVGGSIVAAY